MTQPAGDLTPVYTAPVSGLPAWATPDPSTHPVANIAHRVEFQVIGQLGGWAQVQCTNGWRGWVDARSLVAVSRPEATPRPAAGLNPVITRIGGHAITFFDLLPAAAIVLSALLPWLRRDGGRSNAFRLPVTFLLDSTPSPSPVKVGILLAVLALIGVAAPPRAVRFGAYAVSLAMLVLYIVQLNRLLHGVGAPSGLGSLLGPGVYVGLAAACVGLGSSLFTRPA